MSDDDDSEQHAVTPDVNNTSISDGTGSGDNNMVHPENVILEVDTDTSSPENEVVVNGTDAAAAAAVETSSSINTNVMSKEAIEAEIRGLIERNKKLSADVKALQEQLQNNVKVASASSATCKPVNLSYTELRDKCEPKRPVTDQEILEYITTVVDDDNGPRDINILGQEVYVMKVYTLPDEDKEYDAKQKRQMDRLNAIKNSVEHNNPKMLLSLITDTSYKNVSIVSVFMNTIFEYKLNVVRVREQIETTIYVTLFQLACLRLSYKVLPILISCILMGGRDSVIKHFQSMPYGLQRTIQINGGDPYVYTDTDKMSLLQGATMGLALYTGIPLLGNTTSKKKTDNTTTTANVSSDSTTKQPVITYYIPHEIIYKPGNTYYTIIEKVNGKAVKYNIGDRYNIVEKTGNYTPLDYARSPAFQYWQKYGTSVSDTYLVKLKYEDGIVKSKKIIHDKKVTLDYIEDFFMNPFGIGMKIGENTRDYMYRLFEDIRETYEIGGENRKRYTTEYIFSPLPLIPDTDTSSAFRTISNAVSSAFTRKKPEPTTTTEGGSNGQNTGVKLGGYHTRKRHIVI